MDQYPTLAAMVPDVYNIQTAEGAYEKSLDVGTVPDHQEFTGKIGTVVRTEGYVKTHVFTEYAVQLQIQRKLAADDQYKVVSRFGAGLAVSANRSREKSGANTFVLAFTYAPTDGDAVSLCSSAHPSPVDGVADQGNTGTSAFGAGTLETTRQLMLDFYDLDGEKIPIEPDSIMIYKDNEETAWEIINSKGKVNTPNNNLNFHEGKYRLMVWNRLSAGNWFVIDYKMMKEYLLWWNREPIQYFQDKDSDTLIAKYLSYYRCGTGWDNFRFVYGHNT